MLGSMRIHEFNSSMCVPMHVNNDALVILYKQYKVQDVIWEPTSQRKDVNTNSMYYVTPKNIFKSVIVVPRTTRVVAICYSLLSF